MTPAGVAFDPRRTNTRYGAAVQQIVIARRYNGPPDSGNGGYACGLLATTAGIADAEVTLRRPPPLDVPLRVEDGAAYDGEHVVATVAPAAGGGSLVPPPFPGYDAAHAARDRYLGLHGHPFPTCYVCGPARDDGLGLHPGAIGDGVVATSWTTPADVTDEVVWAALDCPGAWAFLQNESLPIVLGRLAVTITAPPKPGEPHVVVGWQAAPRDGRKHHAGTALYDQGGTLLATGRATWIEVQSGAR